MTYAKHMLCVCVCLCVFVCCGFERSYWLWCLQPALSSRLSVLGAERKAEAFAEARESIAPVLAAIDDNLNTQDAFLQRVKARRLALPDASSFVTCSR